MPRIAPPPVVPEENSHPVLGPAGPAAYQVWGDAGGLTQFGVHVEILPPGSRSSHRHWHEAEDEFIHVLSGEICLIEDRDTLLRPGDSAAWPAGRAIGHALENRGPAEARFLTIGTRAARDVIHHPDHGLTTLKDGPHRRYLRGGHVIGERGVS